MNAPQLLKAVANRKAVIGFHWHTEKPLPAAFIVGMPFHIVAKRLPAMKIYRKSK